MLEESMEAVEVCNYLTSGPYCFVDGRDRKVVYTAVLEVEECWDPELALGLAETLHFLIHFDHILALQQFDEA
jgi:hypothetical protein